MDSSGGSTRTVDESFHATRTGKIDSNRPQVAENGDEAPVAIQLYDATVLKTTAEDIDPEAYGKYRPDRSSEEQKDNTPGTQLMPLRVPRTSKEWSPLLKKQAVPSNDPEANGGEDITIAVRERETPSVDEKWVARFYYARKVMASPNNLAVVVGIAISAIPSLQNMLFNNPRAALWPLGAAVEVRISAFYMSLSRSLKNYSDPICHTSAFVRIRYTR